MRRLRRRPPGSAGRRDADPPPPGQGERAHSPLIGNAVFSSETRGRHQMWESPKGRGRQDARLILQIPGGEAQLAEGSVLRPRVASRQDARQPGVRVGGTARRGPGQEPVFGAPNAQRAGPPTLRLLDTFAPPATMAALPATSPGPQTALSQIQACLLSLLGSRCPKALSCSEGSPGPSRDPCPFPPPSLALEGAQPPQNAPCCVPGPQKPALPSFLQVSAQMSPETPLAPPLPCCVDVSSVGAGNGPVSLRVPYRPSGGTRF